MSGYLLTVIGTVLVCALLTAIVPQGKTSGVIKSVAKLACVLVIVSPVLRFFKTGEIGENSTENAFTFFPQSGIEQDESFIQYYREKQVRETEVAIQNDLAERYAVQTAVTLAWEIENEDVWKYYQAERIKIKEIRVQCAETATKEIRENMWEYLTKNYCSEVLIE